MDHRRLQVDGFLPTVHVLLQECFYELDHTLLPRIQVSRTWPSSSRTAKSAFRPGSNFPLLFSPIMSATFSVTHRTASARLHPVNATALRTHSSSVVQLPISVSVPSIVTLLPCLSCRCGICPCPGCTPSCNPASSMLSVMKTHFPGSVRKQSATTEGCRCIPSGMME